MILHAPDNPQVEVAITKADSVHLSHLFDGMVKQVWVSQLDSSLTNIKLSSYTVQSREDDHIW